MHAPLARLSRAGLAVFAAACLTAALAPTPARAAHWLVDQNGGGDFTTIQEALDMNLPMPRDSILVLPGSYEEAVGGWTWSQLYVVAVEGSALTRISSVTEFHGAQTRLEGFTFTADMLVPWSQVYFSRCVFAGQLVAYGDDGGYGAVNVEDCDFYQPTVLSGYVATQTNPFRPLFKRLRFHGAPLSIGHPEAGPTGFADCTFEGPADVLVDAPGGSDDYLFLNCHFANAKVGIRFSIGYLADAVVGGCTFLDLTETGIDLNESGSGSNVVDGGGFEIGGSRFERCGTAIRAVGPISQSEPGRPAQMEADTILASRGDGVVISSNRRASFHNVIIDGSGGRGIAIIQDGAVPDDPWSAEVVGSTLTHNTGDGLLVEGAGEIGTLPYWSPYPPARSRFSGNTFAHNGGAGLRITGGAWDVVRCASFNNGGDGFACNSTLASGGNLVSNTSVLNRGDGFLVSGPNYPGDSLKFIRNNIAALNAGTGFRVPHQSFGSFAFNDAWGNYQSQYVGAWSSADSNLTVDPSFCDLSAGDLGLQQGSPCGAGGLYGLIGALPEQCPNTTAVEPTAQRLAFAVRPTVARGRVEFVPPTVGPEGRVELFDLSGRRLWGAAFGPTTGTLRWQGESDAGHAQPGLYWVRFTRAGESQSQRLVWLR